METTQNSLAWLLSDFADRTAHVRAVLVTSRDGMLMASHNLPADDGLPATLSAVTSGLQSLAEGAARHLGGSGVVQQLMAELDSVGHLFTMAAGSNAVLTVLSDGDADAGQVAYEMTLLVRQVPGYLSVDSRTPVLPADSLVS